MHGDVRRKRLHGHERRPGSLVVIFLSSALLLLLLLRPQWDAAAEEPRDDCDGVHNPDVRGLDGREVACSGGPGGRARVVVQ